MNELGVAKKRDITVNTIKKEAAMNGLLRKTKPIKNAYFFPNI